MSRFEWTETNAPNIRYSIGYDAPMRTFFAQIHDLAAENDKDYCRLWLGGNFDEYPQLAPMLKKFQVEIPPDILAKIKRDTGQKPRERIIRITFSRVYEYDADDFPEDLDSCFAEATKQAWQELQSDGESGFLAGEDAFSSRAESIPIEKAKKEKEQCLQNEPRGAKQMLCDESKGELETSLSLSSRRV